MQYRKYLKPLLHYGIGVVVIVALLAFVYQDFSWLDVFNEFERLSMSWIAVIMLTTILCHLLRAKRWQLLLRATGKKVKFYPVLEAMMLGYFVNMGIPRLGEVTRCFSLHNKTQIPVSGAIGTVVTERAMDVLFLLLFSALAFITNMQVAGHFFDEWFIAPLSQRWQAMSSSAAIVLLIAVVVSFMAMLLAYRFWLRKKVHQKVDGFIEEMWRGGTGIFSLKRFPTFILQSVVIWVFYYFMTYFWFHAYGPANHIAMVPALAIVAVGNLARTVPLQAGGAGAYHLLMAGILVVYGLTDVEGKFMALAIHALQTSFYLFAGIGFGLLHLFKQNPNGKFYK